MRPIFFEVTLPVIGEVTFPAFMTMMMVGFVVAIWLGRREGERLGMRGDHIVDLGLVLLVLGVMGSRLFAVFTDGMFMDFVHLCTDPKLVDAIDAKVKTCTADAQCGYDYLCDTARHVCYPPRDCLAAFKFWQGGLTFYGGVMLAWPGGMWFAHRKGLGMWRMADIVAPLLMVGLFFGRFGCFFNGCCYGAPTDSWLGVTFPPQSGRPPGPLHPVQLYESAAAAVIFAVLYFVIRTRKRGDGELFGWMMVMYGVWRFSIEWLRVDPRGALGPLSTSQVVSIPMILGGIGLILWARRHGKLASTPP